MFIRNSFLALAAVVPASATALETPIASDLAAGVDGDGAGPLATAAAVLRQPTPYTAHDAAPSPYTNADLGALAFQQRAATRVCPETCPPGYFGYCNGVSIGTETCGEDCCTGSDNACAGFTGCVKNDGSCVGSQACLNAKAPIIKNSCKGDNSCNMMGYVGYVGAVKDSCGAYEACMQFAFQGTIGPVTQSCNGFMACKYIAFGDGTVGPITKSCNSEKACFNLATYRGSGYYGGTVGYGTVGPITKSCNSEKACFELATYQTIKSITKTCNNAHKPCGILSTMSSDPFDFGHLTKFVHADTGAIHTRDSIGSIRECHAACVNDMECNGIKWKEHTGRPCRFFGGAISANLCGGRNVCITME